jgi:lipopolysaccharide transport system permease protein
MGSASKGLYEIRIRPRQNWLTIDLRSIFESRDILYMMVRRDFMVRYRQTILGPIWYLLQPFLTTVVFTIIFNRVGHLSTDGLPPMLFYLAGVTIWGYFSQNVFATANTFVLYAEVFENVYFPRIIPPLATTFSNLIALGVQLISLIGFVVFFKLHGAAVTPRVAEGLILVPLLILQTAVLSLGLGLLFASLTTKYRDFVHLIAFVMQIWLYATPVVYPASTLPDHYRWLMIVNPVAPIIENFRGAILSVSSVTFFETTVSLAFTIVLLLVGNLFFQRVARTFIDYA